MGMHLDFIDSDSELISEVCLTVRCYLIVAIADIDRELGKGYAKNHPELICTYMAIAGDILDTYINTKYSSEKFE